MKKIPQVMPFIGNEELELISKSVADKWLTEGPHSQAFLEHIREYTGSKYAVLAPNGTLGLYLALLALDLPAGSEILIPSFTFFGSVTPAIFAGLVPVFVDVQSSTFNIDTSLIEAAITEKTKVIMPVHIFGHCSDMSEIKRLAEKHDLLVLEDAAQGYGVFYDGKHSGTIGDLGVISFFADKTITMGEGAVVLTQDEKIFRRLKLLRNQGRENSGTFIHEAIGMNFRITDMQAATGLAQARKFDFVLQHKTNIHALYKELLNGVGDLNFLKVQEGSNLVPFRFCLRTGHRDDLIAHLEDKGVQTRSFFFPMHKQPPLLKYEKPDTDCPVSELLYEEGILLPVHVEVSEDDVRYICAAVVEYFKNA